jgi:replication factor A1
VTIVEERRRYDGSMLRTAECLVGDQFGSVIFWAKNEQLDMIKEGMTLTIRNAHANVVKEHLRVEVDKWGKLEQSSEKVASVNAENNLSSTEYELVTVNEKLKGRLMILKHFLKTRNKIIQQCINYDVLCR